jgi:hypothetical protein
LADIGRRYQIDGRRVSIGPGQTTPPLFYLAHLALRHRHTQAVLILPRLAQAVLFRVLVALGTVLGRYRGDGWPGCPSRCLGAPAAREQSSAQAGGVR